MTATQLSRIFQSIITCTQFSPSKNSNTTTAKKYALDDVLELVKSNKNNSFRTIDDITKDIDKIETVISNCLPIEEDFIQTTVKTKQSLMKEKERTESYEKFKGKYLIFPEEVFKWRHDNALPKLVPFSINDPNFYVTVISNYRWKSTRERSDGLNHQIIFPDNLRPVMHLYDDVFEYIKDYNSNKLLSNRTNRIRSVKCTSTISARFSGMIPESTKEKIKEAKNEFPRIFIVAEPELQIHSETKIFPLPEDPVVVGHDDYNFWYIDDFDITAIEEAALLIGPANT